jgi:hypothetical protein
VSRVPPHIPVVLILDRPTLSRGPKGIPANTALTLLPHVCLSPSYAPISKRICRLPSIKPSSSVISSCFLILSMFFASLIAYKTILLGLQIDLIRVDDYLEKCYCQRREVSYQPILPPAPSSKLTSIPKGLRADPSLFRGTIAPSQNPARSSVSTVTRRTIYGTQPIPLYSKPDAPTPAQFSQNKNHKEGQKALTRCERRTDRRLG